MWADAHQCSKNTSDFQSGRFRSWQLTSYAYLASDLWWKSLARDLSWQAEKSPGLLPCSRKPTSEL